MPPRNFTNPAPKTESAREAVKSFYCELCSKGYSRMNEFEAHESSYDHQHKKRLKEMKQMQKDPLAATKARKAERKQDEKSGLISIKPVRLDLGAAAGAASAGVGGGATRGGGFKKAGFKSAFGGGDEEAAAATSTETIRGKEHEQKGVLHGRGERFEDGKVVDAKDAKKDAEEEDWENDTDDGYEYYDPERPTDCHSACLGR